jgi:hypothetical protein
MLASFGCLPGGPLCRLAVAADAGGGGLCARRDAGIGIQVESRGIKGLGRRGLLPALQQKLQKTTDDVSEAVAGHAGKRSQHTAGKLLSPRRAGLAEAALACSLLTIPALAAAALQSGAWMPP